MRWSIPWSVLAIVSLAAATAALAWAALGSTGDAPEPSPTGSAFIDPSPTKTGKTTEPSDARASDVEPALALVDGSIAFRGRTGTCLGGATLQSTSDGGRTWEDLELPVESLLDIEPQSQSVLTIVGSDSKCRPGAWLSNNDGGDWTGPTPTGNAWYRNDDNDREIVTPSGEVPNPCEKGSVVEVEGMTDASAAVLCDSGAIERSDNGGVEWTRVTTIPGAEALAWVEPQNGWLLVSGAALCPGFQLMRTVDGGTTWNSGGCVGVAEDAGPQGVRPSLAYADLLAGMAVVGESTWTTKDGGTAWVQVRPR